MINGGGRIVLFQQQATQVVVSHGHDVAFIPGQRLLVRLRRKLRLVAAVIRQAEQVPNARFIRYFRAGNFQFLQGFRQLAFAQEPVPIQKGARPRRRAAGKKRQHSQRNHQCDFPQGIFGSQHVGTW